MKRHWLVLLFFFSQTAFSQTIAVTKLFCESAEAPLGVEKPTPSLGWQLSSPGRGVLQSAYRILVAEDPALLKKNEGNIWDSHRVVSGQSLHVSYAGKKLVPAKTYYWKVQVWDQQKRPSAWSAVSSWQMGLPVKEDWKGAQWIAYEKMPDSLLTIPAEHGKGSGKGANVKEVLPLFRKTLPLQKPLEKATVFISGLGHFEMSVNGRKIGDHFLDPGWTMYDKEAQYVTFDITKNLQQGNNSVGVQLGNGFYFMPRQRYRKHTGAFGFPKLICRIHLQYRDGSADDVVSDQSWKTSASPVTFSSIYGGEDYDATLEQKGWNTNAFNDASWKQAVLVDGPPVLQSQKQDPVKIMDTLLPTKITVIRDNVIVYDMGQNASGIPFLSVRGQKGDSVRLIPGELLKDDGSVSQKATGSPVYFTYILNGKGKENWQPRFSYTGFRYLQVEKKLSKESKDTTLFPEIVAVKSLHTRNAARTVGSFSSSSPLFNQTKDLIDWAVRSNMQSILTDCPHREKLGWLEQLHLMGNSIHYNYDMERLFQKVLADMRTAQSDSGSLPEYAPEYVKMSFMDGIFLESPEWGSASIILPWYLYQWYGNREVLEENFSVMQRYFAYLGNRAKDNILSHGLSDWYDLGPERQGLAQLTPMGLTATATYFYDAKILSKVAALLGKTNDATTYRALAEKIKLAFNKKFFDAKAVQYGTGSQTANAMALYIGLVPEQYKSRILDNLVKDIRSRNNSITSGDIGFRYLLQALQNEGRSDVIYDINCRSDVPGYGYQLAKGATALTESWVASPVVSNNHLMLGHLMEWFYSGLGGIGQAAGSVGYKSIEINPQPVGDLRFVSTSYECPYGLIRSGWKKAQNGFTLDVQIPVNTTATILLPATAASKIREGDRELKGRKDVRFLGFANGKAKIKVGSGRYQFTVLEKDAKELVLSK
ncbi:family 78 glycoside hydrolase catalytic domain [Flavisolibacter nicotianae]|uniref:family 78 glycoside hydrolase catalytic domain n=1 Tax=Flavisolibacter nicotianae TaxID=2364882 RepID=UPI000EAEC7E6|nr:family 78 glycoside hydrolase catalytic domain [Flavisolibacter nicotianae]